jgi:hypothetical protein
MLSKLKLTNMTDLQFGFTEGLNPIMAIAHRVASFYFLSTGVKNSCFKRGWCFSYLQDFIEGFSEKGGY